MNAIRWAAALSPVVPATVELLPSAAADMPNRSLAS